MYEAADNAQRRGRTSTHEDEDKDTKAANEEGEDEDDVRRTRTTYGGRRTG